MTHGRVSLDRGVVDPPFHVFRACRFCPWGWPICIPAALKYKLAVVAELVDAQR